MSIARTTPAQKPLGFSNNTRFWLGEVSAWFPFEMDSSRVVVTTTSIPTEQPKEQQIKTLKTKGKFRSRRARATRIGLMIGFVARHNFSRAVKNRKKSLGFSP
jgi:hypothetical protein